jgi:hypothetical protein
MLGIPGYQVIRILRIPGYQGASRDITQLPVGCIEPTLYGVSVGYFRLAEDRHVQIMFATGTQFWSKKKHNIKNIYLQSTGSTSKPGLNIQQIENMCKIVLNLDKYVCNNFASSVFSFNSMCPRCKVLSENLCTRKHLELLDFKI